MRPTAEEFHDFYEHCYEPSPDGEIGQRWRELGGHIKAEHVVRLLDMARVASPVSILEVGCGDGAVLQELGTRGVGRVRDGLDISSAAIQTASHRSEITSARVFDGEHIAAEDGDYDLSILTHVLEHAPEPSALLAETARVSRTLIIEVPLERNLSARRSAARAKSEAAGHIHRFSRQDIRRMIRAVGWRPVAELTDSLPKGVHLFGTSGLARGRGSLKSVARAALATLPFGYRLITMHYAVLAVPAPPPAENSH